MSAPRRRLLEARRWIVKIGSTLLTDDGKGLDHALIHSWTADIAALLESNREVILVSSGSIAEGLVRLGWQQRPRAVNELQAAAAGGQKGLGQAYERGFKAFNRTTAQVLLTHDDIADRKRYLNARGTLSTLLSHGVVPIVNENDTVTTAEIKLGDNDTLAAQVANLVDADVRQWRYDNKSSSRRSGRPSRYNHCRCLRANAWSYPPSVRRRATGHHVY